MLLQIALGNHLTTTQLPLQLSLPLCLLYLFCPLPLCLLPLWKFHELCMVDKKACKDKIFCHVDIERSLELGIRQWSVHRFSSGGRKADGRLNDACG